MSEFDHLFDGMAVDGEKTAVYTWHDLPNQPKFDFKPAVEANKPYTAAALKMANIKARKSQRKKDITQKDISRSRKDNARLIIAHCLVGWKDMVDIKGNPVEYSKERAVEFFNSITNPNKVPPRIFQDLLDWIGDEANFREEDEDDITLGDLDDIDGEGEGLGKNSDA